MESIVLQLRISFKDSRIWLIGSELRKFPRYKLPSQREVYVRIAYHHFLGR